MYGYRTVGDLIRAPDVWLHIVLDIVPSPDAWLHTVSEMTKGRAMVGSCSLNVIVVLLTGIVSVYIC